MIITFFGHTEFTETKEIEDNVYSILNGIPSKEHVEFYLGGYGRFDSFAYTCAKKYKEKHKNTKLVFITPYLDKWLNVRKDILKNEYDEIIYPEIENVPKRFAILKRNEWMIDQANYVFAYVKTHYGGAYKTLLYAHKQKKPYTNLYLGNYKLF